MKISFLVSNYYKEGLQDRRAQFTNPSPNDKSQSVHHLFLYKKESICIAPEEDEK